MEAPIVSQIMSIENKSNGIHYDMNGNYQKENTTPNVETYKFKPYKRKLVWKNIIMLTYLHGVFIYSVINIKDCKWQVQFFGK